MHKIARFFTAVIIIILLQGCGRQLSAVIDDPICSLPCWRGITEGKTTKGEVEQILINSPDIQTNSIQKEFTFNELIPESINWKFQGVQEYSGGIFFVDQKAVLSYWTYRSYMSIDRYINKYGFPSQVIITASTLEITYLTIYFIYSDLGLCVEHNQSLLRLPSERSISVRPSIRISNVYLVDPTLPDGQLKIGCLEGFPKDVFYENIQPWNGYGKYKILTEW